MKHILCLTAVSAALAILPGCIKDEEPNIEVDILEVLTDKEGILNIVSQNGMIDIYASPDVDASDMTLTFVLSEGATVDPEPATVTDYTSPRLFKVTSEDRNWVKDYTVSVKFNDVPVKYGFEHWMQPERMRYKIPYEAVDLAGSEERLNVWASGNEAYNFLTNKNDNHTAFPTQPTVESHSGEYAAMLVTKTTPELSKPIASGNLFIGQFDASKRDPRESTMFGLPFRKKPLRIKGWYKYRSGGPTYQSGETDLCRIQAVLYRTDAEVKYLNGLNIKNSPNVVARAEITSSDTPGESFVEFDLPFTYTEKIDPSRLKSGGYNITVIFASSRNGDVYDGAKGSTLIVDDVEIICDTAN